MSTPPDLKQSQSLLIGGIDPRSDAALTAAAAAHFENSAALDADARFSIYRQSITSTRVRALQAIYPVCRQIVGDSCFAGLARRYAWHRPDVTADLNAYGVDFGDFLEQVINEQASFAALPYLPELARLECGLHAVYYAADAPGQVADLSAHAAERLIISPVPGLMVQRMRFPVYEIWRRHQRGAAPDNVHALPGPEHVCVYRDGEVPAVQRVDELDYALLAACMGGVRLAALAMNADFSACLPTRLPALMARDWLRCHIAADEQGRDAMCTDQ